ncbi:unnamed protein product [Acanthosepion pharaonis]|uniref:Uncharacterized protein n=1 Tax=Acanthosepion pharaonis TaxID=158019 RepID=A0A812DN56_ACAPH|nr:unnamed protein product [Sepia pharaonis]
MKEFSIDVANWNAVASYRAFYFLPTYIFFLFSPIPVHPFFLFPSSSFVSFFSLSLCLSLSLFLTSSLSCRFLLLLHSCILSLPSLSLHVPPPSFIPPIFLSSGFPLSTISFQLSLFSFTLSFYVSFCYGPVPCATPLFISLYSLLLSFPSFFSVPALNLSFPDLIQLTIITSSSFYLLFLSFYQLFPFLSPSPTFSLSLSLFSLSLSLSDTHTFSLTSPINPLFLFIFFRASSSPCSSNVALFSTLPFSGHLSLSPFQNNHFRVSCLDIVRPFLTFLYSSHAASNWGQARREHTQHKPESFDMRCRQVTGQTKARNSS